MTKAHLDANPVDEKRKLRNWQILAQLLNHDGALAGDGLGFDADGNLYVKVGNGLEIASDAVAVDLAATPGLQFVSGDLAALVQGVLAIDASGIKLSIGEGLENDGADALRVKIKTDGGIDRDSNGLNAEILRRDAWTVAWMTP